MDLTHYPCGHKNKGCVDCNTTALRAEVKRLRDFVDERAAQDAKWGEQNHEPEVWLAILTEEVGELAQAILRWRFGSEHAYDLRKEAVQAGAVAIAMVECCDRNEWLARTLLEPEGGREGGSYDR